MNGAFRVGCADYGGESADGLSCDTAEIRGPWLASCSRGSYDKWSKGTSKRRWRVSFPSTFLVKWQHFLTMRTTPVSARITLLLGEDQPVVIEGLRHYLAGKPISIASVFQTSAELFAAIEAHPNSVIVSETKFGGLDLLTVLGQLSESKDCPPIVFFSSAIDPVSIARALAMSASDFVFKSEPLQVLEESIEKAARGERPDLSRPITQRRIQLTAARLETQGPSPLTQRELQVLKHIAMGLSNREIGRSLGISVETIKEHVQNILRKLDVNDRTQAAVWAIRNQLL
jgi:DNA-binding NarL/FixJ family response regulator